MVRNDTKDPMANSNGRNQKSSGNQQFENANSVGALGEDNGAGSQATGQSLRWDNSDVCLLEARKGNDPRKSSVLALAKGKEKVNRYENSVVGQQKSKEREEHEVTSPIKPNLISSAEDVVGFLDMGHSKENKPKTKAKWKKLPREQGPADDMDMTNQGNGLGTKRVSGIEALEVKENRVTKKTHEEFLFSDGQQTMETIMVAKQHRRKQRLPCVGTTEGLGPPGQLECCVNWCGVRIQWWSS